MDNALEMLERLKKATTSNEQENIEHELEKEIDGIRTTEDAAKLVENITEYYQTLIIYGLETNKPLYKHQDGVASLLASSKEKNKQKEQEEQKRINEIFESTSQEIRQNVTNKQHKKDALELMEKLKNYKETNFPAGKNYTQRKEMFINECKNSIENEAEKFKGNLELKKLIANCFINLVNLLLRSISSSRRVGLFEAKQTKAQAIIKDFESALGINKKDEQPATDETQSATVTA